MPIYEVTRLYVVPYTIQVDAPTEQDAIDISLDLLLDGDGDASDGGFSDDYDIVKIGD